MAVSGLYEIVGNGPALFDQGLADQHIVVEEDDAVTQDTGPPTGRLTGAIIDLPFSVVLITSRNLNEDQQAVAFAIFRSITP